MQRIKSLPNMARAATNSNLKALFESHLEETRGQILRLDLVVESCRIKLMQIKCAAMEGLIEEGQQLVDEIEKGAVLDAGLISAAQKVEHDEITTDGTLAALAKKLGEKVAVKMLLETLEEEEAADLKLTRLVDEEVSEEAAAV